MSLDLARSWENLKGHLTKLTVGLKSTNTTLDSASLVDMLTGLQKLEIRKANLPCIAFMQDLPIGISSRTVILEQTLSDLCLKATAATLLAYQCCCGSAAGPDLPQVG